MIFQRILPALGLFLFLTAPATAQTFTWKQGSNTVNSWGSYGTLGVPSASNNPGGRESAASWKDGNGNLWVFGGFGFDVTGAFDMLNDLWKYDPALSTWTWVHGDKTALQPGIYGTLGVAAATNKPGGRTAPVSWTDNSGNLWMFGGFGYDANTSTYQQLNDLWKYNISSDQWTWVSGDNTGAQPGVYGTQGAAAATNKPGSRTAAMAWQDGSGNFWLFGGVGLGTANNPGPLNDLWKYDAGLGQWIWITGSSTVNQIGSYGTQGIASSTNVPGGRGYAASWTDNSGSLWLFGGVGNGTNTANNKLNDLWKFDPVAVQWTWMRGANTGGQLGTYGTIGVPTASNEPGSRGINASWKDASGNFWIFGGSGYAGTVGAGVLNDLWKYDISTNQWTWMKGGTNNNEQAVYGTEGVPDVANIPGAREGAAAWYDASFNRVVLFGGGGYDATASSGQLNDLWSIENCTAQAIVVTSSNSLSCSDQQVTLQVSGAATYSWVGSGTGSSISVSPGATATYSVVGTDAAGCNTVATITQSVAPAADLIFTVSNAIICTGNSGTLSVAGGVSYTWSTNQNTPSIIVFPQLADSLVSNTVTYSVTATDSFGCRDTASVAILAVVCTGLGNNGSLNDGGYKLYPNPSRGSFVLSSSTEENEILTIYNALGEKVAERSLTPPQTTISAALNSGLYYYSVCRSGRATAAGKLIIE